MQLYNHAIELQDQNADDGTVGDIWPDLHNDNVDAALRVATIVRDYREAFGFQITGTLTWQAAVFALYVFLPHMKPDARLRTIHSFGLRDIDAGFTECFRCLLASGLFIMLPRAIARMIYRTSLEMQIDIPEDVKRMLVLIADTAWQPSDVHCLASSFPNWLLVDHRNVAPATYRMGDILQRWEALNLSDDGI